MSARSFDEILKRPVISEKSYAAMSVGRYVFRCHPRATKIEIARAVEEAFVKDKVTVVAVNTLNVRGKTRQRSRGSRRIMGQSPDWKKAIVTLAPGQQIKDLFGNV